MSGKSDRTTLQQSRSSPVATHAQCGLWQKGHLQAVTPIFRDTSLPWSQDYAHGGFSARMFLHRMYTTSRPGWTPSDTDALLSNWTVRTLRPKVGSGNSVSDALMRVDSGHYLPYASIVGMVRHVVKRERRFRVLLPTRIDPVKTLTAMKTDEGYDFSIAGRPRRSWDSLEVGLVAFLEHAVASCSAMPLFPERPNGSDGGS